MFCPPTVDSTQDINVELTLDLSLVLGFTAPHFLKCTYLVILTYHSELTLTYYDWVSHNKSMKSFLIVMVHKPLLQFPKIATFTCICEDMASDNVVCCCGLPLLFTWSETC